VLQCVAVCCRVLRCVAECCIVLQCVEEYCSILLQRFAQDLDILSCANVLSCNLIAVCCNMLLCAAVCCRVLLCVASCCSVLQCVAVCCSVLQCVAVCFGVLQCFAVLQWVVAGCRRPRYTHSRQCLELQSDCNVLQRVVLQVAGDLGIHTRGSVWSCNLIVMYCSELLQ